MNQYRVKYYTAPAHVYITDELRYSENEAACLVEFLEDQELTGRDMSGKDIVSIEATGEVK